MEEEKFLTYKATYDVEKKHLSFSKIRMKTKEEMMSCWESVKSQVEG